MFFLFEIKLARYNEAEHNKLKLRWIFRRKEAVAIRTAVALAKCSRKILRRSTKNQLKVHHV